MRKLNGARLPITSLLAYNRALFRILEFAQWS
jgi:hypothetical protein